MSTIVVGYDETPVPPETRSAERETAKRAWRRYRQELYIDQDPRPLAVIQWLHTISGIRIVRIDPQREGVHGSEASLPR